MRNQTEMTKVIAWAKKNAHLSHTAPDLLVGTYHQKAFRVFVRDGWAAVRPVDQTSWSRCPTAETLTEFVRLLELKPAPTQEEEDT